MEFSHLLIIPMTLFNDIMPCLWLKNEYIAGLDINACPIARGKCEREKNDFGQVNGWLEKPERSS